MSVARRMFCSPIGSRAPLENAPTVVADMKAYLDRLADADIAAGLRDAEGARRSGIARRSRR